MATDAWRRLALWLGGLLLALSAVISFYPDAPARPLLPADGIVVDTGFQRSDLPASYEVRSSIRKSPATLSYRSWRPESGSLPGAAHSQPFHVPAYMVVPYQGFAGEPGIRLYVECLATGAQLEVANARNNTQWSEAIVSRPHGWCAGNARLVATSNSSRDYLAFATPYRINAVSWLKTRFLGLLFPFVLLFACVAGLCLGASALAARRWPQADPIAAGMIALGVVGFAMFFAFQAGRVFASMLSLAISGYALVSAWRILRADASVAAVYARVAQDWRWPLLAWLVVALFCFAVLHAVDNGAGAWLANARFAPVRWSSDNQLPMLAGEYLVRKSLLEMDLGRWLVSDRTPLSYGLHAWLRATSLLPTLGNDGHYLAPALHGAIGIVINTTWVPVLVHMLASLGLGKRRVVLALTVAVLLPFCLFNSIYAWPKLLGGAFALLALWLLLLQPRDAQAPRDVGWLPAAALSALALLCHGGTMFGILAMLLFAPFVRPLPRLRTMLACVAIAGALLAPWTAWQKLVQPPGNALVKYVFSGNNGWDDPPGTGVLATIRHSYSALDAGTWLQMKADGLRSIALPPQPMTCAQGEMDDAHGIGAWRVSDFIAVVPSIKFLWLGLFALPWLLARGGPDARARTRPGVLLLGVGLAGVGLNLLLAWGCQIIHTQSYQSLLAIILGLLLLLDAGPRWLYWCAATASIAYGLLVWVLDPLLEGLRLDPLAIAACVALLLAAPLLARGTPYNTRPPDPAPSR